MSVSTMSNSLLSSTNSPSKSPSTFVLLQSTLATPWISFARTILSQIWSNPKTRLVCLCRLYSPVDILPNELLGDSRVTIIDWTNIIPGYTSDGISWDDKVQEIDRVLQLENNRPLTFFIDSPHTIFEDIDPSSPSRTYKVLKQWLTELLKHPSPSMLLTHIPTASSLLPLILPPTFSPSLTHMTLHPPVFIAHLIDSYSTYPPSHSQHSSAKFWPLFTGISTRASAIEVEAMVWGSEGNGWMDGSMVVEIVSRHPSGRHTVDRTLEGWAGGGQFVQLADLPELKPSWKAGGAHDNAPSPSTQAAADLARDLNLSFNVTLTEKQQSERARVPLPYAHEGNPVQSTIYYDPDSGDDIDEDDPDEDLDI